MYSFVKLVLMMLYVQYSWPSNTHTHTHTHTHRCGGMFCAVHRYAESHSCTFDYKAEGRRMLARNNPVVTAPKLPKI